jgi:glucose/arabinose dehydrogenase
MTAAGYYLGRPVDVQQYVDGSILVSDDKAGAVYRISYQK